MLLGGGFMIAAAGVELHLIWLLYLGYGVVGGIGLGIGYISPVSTLIKWFPDRRGMATGMAIMGFGGGALIGAPLADALMKHYATPTSLGVWQTFVTMGAIYFVFMMGGAFGYRLPPTDWKPAGWTPSASRRDDYSTARQCQRGLEDSAVLVSLAGALHERERRDRGAGPGVPDDPGSLSREGDRASAAAGFVGLLSLFNIARPDRLGFALGLPGAQAHLPDLLPLGTLLYALAPTAGRLGNVVLFVLIFCVILTMYGGGFATIPAYLADIFGTQFVGAIHGRLLTAWSTAGVLGPVLVNYLRQYQIDHGVAKPRRTISPCMCLRAVSCGLLQQSRGTAGRRGTI